MELVFGSGPICRGFDQADGYTLSLTQRTTSTGTAGATGTQRDATTQVVSGANVDSVFSVQLSDAPTYGTTITNLTPGVATFVGSGIATWVSNGVARIQAANSVYGTSIMSQIVQRTSVGMITEFTGYIMGSVAADLTTMIDAAVSGATASPTTTARFSALATNTRNAALWCGATVDDTAISREIGAAFTLMSLIGPKHVLTAAHIPPGAGTVLGWVGSDGVGYVGTVVSTGFVTNTDIGISYMRDATGPEIAAYNAANPTSKAATQPISVAFSGSVIKPFAMFPAGVWAVSNCALCLDTGVMSLPNWEAVSVFHTTRNNAIALWGITDAPKALTYNNGLTYQSEFQIQQPTSPAAEVPFGAFANTGDTASGDITYTAIPAGSSMATNNSGLGAGYPILLGTTHGSPGGSAFESPWVSLQLTGITSLMQSLAQAAGDPAYSTYTPIQVSLTGYSTY